MHGGAWAAGEERQLEAMQMTQSYWTPRKLPPYRAHATRTRI